MNWLIVGFTLFFFYLIWFGRLIKHRNYSRLLLIVALAHFPYLIANLVAPFRGVLDPNYVGYEFGLLRIPAGIGVTLIVGAIVISSFLIATRALKSQMENFWLFTFLFDLFLLISMAGPLILDILADPTGSNIQLGEFLTISGLWVALIAATLFTIPTLFATIISAKHVHAIIYKQSLNSK